MADSIPNGTSGSPKKAGASPMIPAPKPSASAQDEVEASGSDNEAGPSTRPRITSPTPRAASPSTELLPSALSPTSGNPISAIPLLSDSLTASGILSPPPPTAVGRISLDSNRSSIPEDADRLQHLEAELSAVRNEKEVLSGQYRGLLGKLTAMRQSLGDKLREDAEELDRRETTINALTSTNDQLQTTLSTLQSELESASSESVSLQSQLAQLRSQSDSSSSDVLSLTREMRELRGEMERLRVEREEWEGEAGRERERREVMEEDYRQMERREREARREAERASDEAEGERTRGNNLQEVLSEFQAGTSVIHPQHCQSCFDLARRSVRQEEYRQLTTIAKESELRSATTDLEKQLQAAATSLSEYKLRCANAETKLSENSGDAGRLTKLEKDIKEKERLISKLRHDAVVNNEHLTEALRRLRKTSSDNNVDRRLVTNILLSFLGTSRGDTKRFEMLNILSTILAWDDREREKAGLQRSNNQGKAGAPKMARKGSGREEGRSAEEEAAMNESFSNLFVEFLLKEASQGQPRRQTQDGNLAEPLSAGASRAHSPLTPTHPLPPPSLPSFSPTGTGASTPFFGRERTFSTISGVSGLMSPTYPDRPGGGASGNGARKGSYTLSSALSGDKTPGP